MLFNSLSFIILFLPAFIVSFNLIKIYKPHLSMLIISGFSLLFYWNFGAQNPAIIVSSVIVNYCFARYMYEQISPNLRQKLLIFGIAFNLLILFYFKYYNFIASEIFDVIRGEFVPIAVILPLAISFFTFQQISFLFDTYSKKISSPPFLHYFAYVTFFPQLIAGPIVRFDQIANQFTECSKSPSTKSVFEDLFVGIFLFVMGLIKKVVFADTLGSFVDPTFDALSSDQQISSIDAWIAMICFTLQIYFDFSGYSDMAVGLARMVGIHLPLNFLSPFKARNIGEFWRSWHITLTKLVTEYLFTPLSIVAMRKFSQNKFVHKFFPQLGLQLPTLTTFAILGLWHGAGWNFVFFGFLHGIYMIAATTFGQLCKRLKINPLTPVITRLITFFCVNISFVFFRSDNWQIATDMLQIIFFLDGLMLPTSIQHLIPSNFYPIFGELVSFVHASTWQGSRPLAWLCLSLIIVLQMPNTNQIACKYMRVQFYPDKKPETASWIYDVKLCALGIVGAGIVVITFFQTSVSFTKMLPTHWTLSIYIVAIILMLFLPIKDTSHPTLKPNLFWLFLLVCFFSIGIIDLLVDGGVEFLYFEF